MKRRELPFTLVLIGLPPIIHHIGHAARKLADWVEKFSVWLAKQFIPS